jgi:hypothetical protein
VTVGAPAYVLVRPSPTPASLALDVREVSIDFIEVEKQTLRSRWFHSEQESDLFVWMDERGRLFKAQANVLGQVLEWNIMHGVRTGVAVENELQLTENEEPTLREQILFDGKPRRATQDFIIAFVSHLTCLEVNLQRDVCEAFRGEAALSLMRHFNPDNDPFETALSMIAQKARKLWGAVLGLFSR